jgi:hypothetical protein
MVDTDAWSTTFKPARGTCVSGRQMHGEPGAVECVTRSRVGRTWRMPPTVRMTQSSVSDTELQSVRLVKTGSPPEVEQDGEQQPQCCSTTAGGKNRGALRWGSGVTRSTPAWVCGVGPRNTKAPGHTEGLEPSTVAPHRRGRLG